MQKSVENALQQVGTDEIRGERPFVCICQDANENFANNLLHCDSCEDWWVSSALVMFCKYVLRCPSEI